MKNIVLIVMLMIGLTSFSQETRGKAELSEAKKNKNAKYNIEVNGNCEMCKKRIEKAAFSVPGVKSATWHIDDHILHLIVNEEKCDINNIEKAITKVGHDTKSVKAINEDYEKLHGCCQYERIK